MIEVEGLPTRDLNEYVVVRHTGKRFWFYCDYTILTDAIEASEQIGNGLLVHRDWLTTKKVEVKISPMLRQFYDLKKKHPDALLLFRVGDFYETYSDDAEKASKILGITLVNDHSKKDKNGTNLKMAGFPYHALDTYLPKLIRAGQRVAICDAIETSKPEKKKCVDELPGMEKSKTNRGFHR